MRTPTRQAGPRPRSPGQDHKRKDTAACRFTSSLNPRPGALRGRLQDTEVTWRPDSLPGHCPGGCERPETRRSGTDCPPRGCEQRGGGRPGDKGHPHAGGGGGGPGSRRKNSLGGPCTASGQPAPQASPRHPPSPHARQPGSVLATRSSAPRAQGARLSASCHWPASRWETNTLSTRRPGGRKRAAWRRAGTEPKQTGFLATPPQ